MNEDVTDKVTAVGRRYGIRELANVFSGLRFGLIGTLSDQAIVSGSSFMFSILVARIAGAEFFGELTLVVLGIQLAALVQSALLVMPHQTLDTLNGTANSVSIGASRLLLQQMFAFVCAVIISAVIVRALGGGLAGGAGWIFPMACFVAVYAGLSQDYLRRINLAAGNWKTAICGDMVRYLGILVWILAAGSAGVTLTNYLIALAVTSVLATAFSVPLLLELRYVSWVESKGLFQRYWAFSRWLLFAFAIQWINANAIFYSIGWATDKKTVGLVRMAQFATAVFLLAIEGLETTLPARAAQKYSNSGLANLEKYLKRAGLQLAIWAIVLSLPFIFASHSVMHLVFGKSGSAVPASFVLPYAIATIVIVPSYMVNIGLRTLSLTASILRAEMSYLILATAGCLVVFIWHTPKAALFILLSGQCVRLSVLMVSYRKARNTALNM